RESPHQCATHRGLRSSEGAGIVLIRYVNVTLLHAPAVGAYICRTIVAPDSYAFTWGLCGASVRAPLRLMGMIRCPSFSAVSVGCSSGFWSSAARTIR